MKTKILNRRCQMKEKMIKKSLPIEMKRYYEIPSRRKIV